MTVSPTPRADDMVRNQAVASLMRQELTDETPAESYCLGYMAAWYDAIDFCIRIEKELER